ncbi:MAG: patatin-like phospholipase family protein [Myxococcota bacterium]|nr:patatin-like phospholipase family protein [Myxococcota bacterium]
MARELSFTEQLRDKRVGLCLASGFFGFYHHAGVLSALEAAGIYPVRITGTSAGALTAAMYATGMNVESIRDALVALERKSFWDMTWPFGQRGVGLLAGHRFQSELGRVLPVHSFEACRLPLAVGVYNIDVGRVVHLSEGPLIPAVYASCALPYLFSPARIGKLSYWDGGVGEKCPLIPFLKGLPVDVVLVSYMGGRRIAKPKRTGLAQFLPPLSSLFVDTPLEERLERDRASVDALRAADIEVLVFAPERLGLGPFSMHRGARAFEMGRLGMERMLASADPALLGASVLF